MGRFVADLLITGGAGFIGVNLVRYLAAQGPDQKLRIVDNLATGRKEDLMGLPVEFIEGDIRDFELVDAVMRDVKAVVHLAAHTGVTDSVTHPEIDMAINIHGTLNLLRAAVRHGVERFIFASTGGAIIGEATPPVHEDMVPRPLSPYGASKLAGEGYCSAFWGSYGLKTIPLRFSNAYGPYSYHKSSVIAKFFKQLSAGEGLTVYGDGEQTRDFVFVEDICRAIITALSVDLEYGQPYQLGTGKATSINDLVALMRQVVGESRFPSITYASQRPGEVRYNFVTIDKAKKYLNFSPSTELLSGLERTWEWFCRMAAPGVSQ